MFCKTVWNGLHILPDGYIRLCSLGTNSRPYLDLQRARDRNGNVMHILTHSLEEIMNSDKHREVRSFNVANPGKWSPHCECCENREIVTNFDKNHPNKSRRVYLMRMDTNDIVNENNFFDKTDKDGNIDWMPNSLDIRFGNLCNQKCIMCSPVFSNQWYDEWFDYYNVSEFGQGKKIKIFKENDKWIQPDELKWFENPIWWEKFEKIAPHLRHIYITGGEPMITPAHDEMLDRLISKDYAKNIWLEYDSNCSAINTKIISRWKNFNNIHIRASMDAIDEQYELIRYGGKWEKFQENIEKIKQYEKTNHNIKLLSVTSCFQLSTIFEIIKSENWAKSKNIKFHLRFLEGPKSHSVDSLSGSAKQELINYFEQYSLINESSNLIINYLKKNKFKKQSREALVEYIKFMDYLDLNRNTSWKNIFSETYNLVVNDINRNE